MSHLSYKLKYSLIAILGLILSIIVVWHFGFNFTMGFALLLTWGLLTLAIIDWQTQLLPDVITLPFLWLGLLLGIGEWFSNSSDAIIGAVAGYVSLWLLAWIFQRVTGKIGMGHGDFKLLAMLGAWLGWQMLPLILLIASLLGSLVGISLMVIKKQGREIPIAFGPYLAAAGWLALLWGQQSLAMYGQLLR